MTAEVQIDDARSDESLLADYARSGDRRALDLLVKRRHAQAYRFALRVLGDEAAAEDAAAEAFVALLRNARSFESGRAFGPWWTTLVANTVRNVARTRRRQQAREARAAAVRPTVAEPASEGIDRAELASRVRELPVDVRIPVILHYYEGRSHAEVAEVLGCPKGTAASRIRRGVEQLRESLAVRAVVSIAAIEATLAQADAAPAAPPPPTVASLEERAAARAARALAGKLAVAVSIAAIGALVLVSRGSLEEVVVAVGPGGQATPVTLDRPEELPAPIPSAVATPDAPPPEEAQPRVVVRPKELDGPGPDAVRVPFGAPPPAGATEDPVDPDLPVHANTGVRGRVVDSSGKAVAGASVQLSGTRAGSTMRQIKLVRASPDGPAQVTVAGESRSRTATTDEDGRFEVRGLDAAYRYELHVTPSSDYLPVDAAAPALRQDSVVDAGTITVKKPARIAGIVRGPRKEPIAGARVRLEGGSGPMLFMEDEEEEAPQPGKKATRMVAFTAAGSAPMKVGAFGGPQLPSARTDEQGRFVLEKVPPGSHVLAASKKGFTTARLPGLQVGEGTQLDRVELDLGEGLSLAVLVKDAAGTPVAGAQVRVAPGPGTPGVSATTDPQGEARLVGISSRAVELSVDAEGFVTTRQTLELGGEPERRTVVLRRGVTLTGRVTSGGKPVAKAFCIPEPRLMRASGFSASANGTTDEDGRFTIKGLAPGEYRLRVMSHEGASAVVDLSVPESVTDHDAGEVVLPALASLEVTVTDPEGRPVPGAAVETVRGMGGAMVVAKIGTGPGGLPGAGETRTDERGVATLQGLEPGPVSVRASKTGFADGQSPVVTLRPGETGHVTAALTLGARVSGTVVGPDGAPRADVGVVILQRGSFMPLHETTSGRDGTFEFLSLAPGTYGVRLLAARAEPEWFTLRDGEVATRTVTVPRGTSVQGTVRLASGAPVGGASVAFGSLAWYMNVAPEVRFPLGKATTEAQGRFAIDLTAEAPTGAGFTVTTPDGRTWSFRGAGGELAIPDAATATVRASVTDEAGVVAGAPVTLERQGDGLVVLREAATDDAGAVAFAHVPAGRYLVAASSPGKARATATVDVGAGEALVPPLALARGGSILLEVAGERDAFLSVRPADEPPGEVHHVLASPGKPIRVSGLRVGVLYEVSVLGPSGGPKTRVRCDGDAQAPVIVKVQD